MANVNEAWSDEEEEEPMEVPEPFEIGPDGHGVAADPDEEEDPEEEVEPVESDDDWSEAEGYVLGESPPPVTPASSEGSDPPTPPPAVVPVPPPAPAAAAAAAGPSAAYLDYVRIGAMPTGLRWYCGMRDAQKQLREERADWDQERRALLGAIAERDDEILSMDFRIQGMKRTLTRYRYMIENDGREPPHPPRDR